jgi:hypothetical protein
LLTDLGNFLTGDNLEELLDLNGDTMFGFLGDNANLVVGVDDMVQKSLVVLKNYPYKKEWNIYFGKIIEIVGEKNTGP